MAMSTIRYPIRLFVSTLFLMGCEDVIELDLNETAPRIVIAAELNATEEQLNVTLSESNSFYEIEKPEALTNARIELHLQNQTKILKEIEPGSYVATQIAVAPFDSVSIDIFINGSVYSATAIVPSPGPLVDLEQSELPNLPFREEGSVRLSAIIEDDPNSLNYYRIKLSDSEDNEYNEITVFDDAFADPAVEFSVPIRETFLPEATVRVELLSTNKAYYTFFYQLSLLTSERSGDITPFNPMGNFNNNALGYFGIYYSSVLDVTVD